jgi:hypothetical protein
VWNLHASSGAGTVHTAWDETAVSSQPRSQQVAARFDKYQKLYVQSERLTMGGGSTRNMDSVIEINKLRKVTSCWWYSI